EDGIRDDLVTGVQTCALPIYARNICARRNAVLHVAADRKPGRKAGREFRSIAVPVRRRGRIDLPVLNRRSERGIESVFAGTRFQIGRASCRERVWFGGVE